MSAVRARSSAAPLPARACGCRSARRSKSRGPAWPLTSTLRSERDGNVRFAKGLEVGFSGDDKVRMSIGGRPVAGLAPGRRGPDGDRLGVSTLAWVGIGVAVTLAVGTVLLVDAMNDASE